jgi:hypothetical protein
VLRLGLDGFQYLLTGRCYCLNSGAGAIWLHLITKFVYYRFDYFLHNRGKFAMIGLVYLVFAAVFMLKGRIDLFLGVLTAVLDVTLMRGGTIKYPKMVYQEKEDWTGAIRLNRLSIWQPFRWN